MKGRTTEGRARPTSSIAARPGESRAGLLPSPVLSERPGEVVEEYEPSPDTGSALTQSARIGWDDRVRLDGTIDAREVEAPVLDSADGLVGTPSEFS